MALTDSQKIQLKNWAKNSYELLLANPSDTTPERIKANREKLLPFVSEMRELISQLLPLLPVAVKTKADVLVALLDDYYRYFDVGYRSPNNIDTLPSLIKGSLAELSRYGEV